MAHVENRGREYKHDEATVEHIQRLAEALTAQTPKLGFLLCGTCGNGKTTLLYAFQSALVFLHNTQGMTSMVSTKDGLLVVDALELATMARQRNEEFQAVIKSPLLAIEDMGKEAAEVSSYGNIINPVAEAIERRYDKQLFTAVTSNLSPKMLSDKYGARVADRFREMLVTIPFTNESYR